MYVGRGFSPAVTRTALAVYSRAWTFVLGGRDNHFEVRPLDAGERLETLRDPSPRRVIKVPSVRGIVSREGGPDLVNGEEPRRSRRRGVECSSHSRTVIEGAGRCTSARRGASLEHG